jgi:protein-tyrosine-phosphatase
VGEVERTSRAVPGGGIVVREHVAVVGTHSPERVLVMAAVLADEIARHGWSERVSVVAAGVGPGAGSPTLLASLAAAGLDLDGVSCPDLAVDPGPLDDADRFVVGSGEDADLFLQWPQADGKEVVALADFVEGSDAAVDDPLADLDTFIAEVRDVMPHVLRVLIAERT